jgi:LysR family hydrogen peroxide-inducible transcriptional activator
MTLTQLSYILAVDQHRSFGMAAQACFVTQPTLSMQIQKLEEDLGVLIFDRSVQPTRPTELGRKILEQAKITVSESRKIEQLVKERQMVVEGELRLGVIPTLAPYLIPRFVRKLVAKYPKLNLVIEELQTDQIIEQLAQGRIDLGLLVTPLHRLELKETVLFHEPFTLYVSPTSALAKKTEVREKDLSSEDVWLLSEGHCFRSQALSLCSDSRPKTNSHHQLRFESGNLETLKKMVDQGEGYTLLPWLATLDLSESRRKKQLKSFASPVPTREVSLVHSHYFSKTAIFNALQAEIGNSIPDDLVKLKKSYVVEIEPTR